MTAMDGSSSIPPGSSTTTHTTPSTRAWTKFEDVRLCAAVRENSDRWMLIASAFPGRSSSDCMARHNELVAKDLASPVVRRTHLVTPIPISISPKKKLPKRIFDVASRPAFKQATLLLSDCTLPNTRTPDDKDNSLVRYGYCQCILLTFESPSSVHCLVVRVRKGLDPN
jgi:hypothetical protein